MADLLPPARLFVLCVVVGSGLNAGLLLPGASPRLVLRFGTGLFLVGIYLVGMKIAADYFETGLGPARCGSAAHGAGVPSVSAGALGCFGHMWELHAFRAFVLLLLAIHAHLHPGQPAYGPVQ